MDSDKPSVPALADLTLTHDGYFRETFQVRRIARGILKKGLPAGTLDYLDLDGLTVEDRHLSDDMFKDTVADVIYRVPIRNSTRHVHFFVIVEHKSYSEPLTIFQLWGYSYRLCLRELREAEKRGEVGADYQLPPVMVMIIHHGDARFQGKTELAEVFYPLPGLETYYPRLQAFLFDLSTIADNDPILNDPEVPELRVVLMVLKTIFRHDVPLTLNDVLRELKPHSDNSETRRIIRATWFYLVCNARYLRKNFEALQGIFKGVIGERNMSTMVEIWKAEGKAEGQARSVLRLLRKKFKMVPADIEEAVLAMSDPIALESLLDHADDSETLDEFAMALQ
jgi:hypothetical protein